MSTKKITQRPLRAKLIFNATSGRPQESPQQLADILTEMQNQNIQPEVFMVSPDSDAEGAVRRAIREGIRLIVVAGGDGTIDSVMGALVGSPATLGIIPTGTRNNVSFNVGVPSTVPEAVALLREGRRLKIDVGHLRSGHATRWFLEAASLGLLSDLYPAADDIQHGDLGQIGTLVSTFVASTPSRLRAVVNGHHRFGTNAYMVLIANMPYLGPRMQIATDVSCRDSRLDVFVFSEMSKLDLISMAMQSAGGPVEHEHVKHYRVRQLKVRSDPLMPVLADGIILAQGAVTVQVHPRALAVIAGESGPAIDNQTGARRGRNTDTDWFDA
ncbi:MAG: diacylglycerol/lipid kinase family protein [Anaerolineales bacterium]